MIEIRPETLEDLAGIYEVHRLAFGRENEARLVERIRNSANFYPELSLIAIKNSEVVGHILLSAIIIQSPKGEIPAWALAPLAVLPAFQNQGIGSQLTRQGLQDCQRLGHKVIVVIGHPSYYPRFGFSSARNMGLEVPFPVPDEAFMVFEQMPGGLDEISGMVKYPPAFDEI